MPDSIHSTLSPSSAAIWLKCPPAALLNAKLPQEESEYAKEGTEAHALAEYKLKKLLGIKADDPRSSFSYLTDEMEAHTTDYASFVYEKIKALKECGKNPHVMIEQRLEFSAYVPEGFGYADAVIISDDEIEIIDLKYGAGVLVDAEMNPQFLIYALGALELASALYDVKKVSLTAFQPRKENISEFSISKEDLLKWAEEVLVPSAKLASSGGGDFNAGEHCRFCRSRFTCRKRTEYCLIAARYDFSPPAKLTDAEIASLLLILPSIEAWVSDIKEHALKCALSGTEYEGFKVVLSRSSRKYTDEEEVIKVAQKEGFDPIEKTLLSVSKLEKLMGKEKFESALSDLIIKVPGKPTLAPISDKRKSIKQNAKSDFNENVNC